MNILEFTDLHVKIDNGTSSPKIKGASCLCFPGPVSPADDDPMLSDIEQVMAVAMDRNGKEFVVNVAGNDFRIHRNSQAVDGTWYRIRRTESNLPMLNALTLKLQEPLIRSLLSSKLNSGGIILITGAPGSGKTTTASSIVKTRLSTHGGFAYTVEDPPEILSLNGKHGKGFCTQTHVYEGAQGWEKSIRDLLRCQPVGTNLILFVGEVRTREAASMLLRAATNGFLVITTSFATDIKSGLDSFMQLIDSGQEATFANAFRMNIYQRLEYDKNGVLGLKEMAIASESGSSRVALLLKQKLFSRLEDEISYQSKLLSSGKALF